MSLINDFSESLAERAGKSLWRQFQGYNEKLAAASPAVANGALLLFAGKRRELLEQIDNMSSNGRVELGQKLQREGRSTFDQNMTDGFAYWLAGAWLESMERPGDDAIQTHDTLELMAHNAERVAHSSPELVSVEENWSNTSPQYGGFGTPPKPEPEVTPQKETALDRAYQRTADLSKDTPKQDTRNRPEPKVQVATPRLQSLKDSNPAASPSPEAKPVWHPALQSLGMLLLLVGLVLILVKLGTKPPSEPPSNPPLNVSLPKENPPQQETATQEAVTSPASPMGVTPTESPGESPGKGAQSNRDNQASAAQKLYVETLKQSEANHPEINPRHASYRKDLHAFVLARMNDHVKEGYPKHKALQIAVRDLEFRDRAPPTATPPKTAETSAPAAPVLDKGGHSGFDPACRWVTPQEWSCKKQVQDPKQ